MGYRGWNAGKGWVTEWQTTATIGRSLKTVESSINQAAAIEGYLQTLRFYLFFLPRAERNYFLPSSSARYLEFLRVRRADQLVIQEQLIFAGSPWVSSDWLFLMKMLFADEVWKFFSRSIPFLTKIWIWLRPLEGDLVCEKDLNTSTTCNNDYVKELPLC